MEANEVRSKCISCKKMFITKKDVWEEVKPSDFDMFMNKPIGKFARCTRCKKWNSEDSIVARGE